MPRIPGIHERRIFDSSIREISDIERLAHRTV